MLIEFSVANFRSFHEPATFSMEAAKLSAREKSLDERNSFYAGKTRLLKSAAIYGPNASGKSNFIKAMLFMRRFILDSSKDTQSDEPIDVESFRLSTDTDNQPSSFEVVFYSDHRKYRYGFEVTAERVHSEWLYHTPSQRETSLFLREGDAFKLSSVFKEGRNLTDKTRGNALFLSVVAQFNGSIASNILKWFRNVRLVSGLHDLGYRSFTVKRLEGGEHRQQIVDFVKKLDLGITDINVERTDTTEDHLPKGLPEELVKFLLTHGEDRAVVTTSHVKYGQDNRQVSLETFDIDRHESEGTKKIFSLSGPLMDVLDSGSVYIVDELDARLHPLITSAVIALFNSRETNPHNAQLIFTTHDTNLLSNKIFRRDQIWFTEKNKFGATDIYSLAEIKVRNDASFEKDYISGKYGAIPFIGGIERLGGEANV